MAARLEAKTVLAKPVSAQLLLAGVAEITTAPQAIPAATGVVCDAHVRAYAHFGSLPCCKQAPHKMMSPLVQVSEFAV